MEMKRTTFETNDKALKPFLLLRLFNRMESRLIQNEKSGMYQEAHVYFVFYRLIRFD